MCNADYAQSCSQDSNSNHTTANTYDVEIAYFDHPATANISNGGLNLQTAGPIAAGEVWNMISSTFWSIHEVSPGSVIGELDDEERSCPGRVVSLIRELPD